MDVEQRLGGGNAGGEVVRVGSTVRESWSDATPYVLDFVSAIRSAGVDVPAVMGRDDQGRQVTEFIPGMLALHADALTPAELGRVGGIIREIHDASETYEPDPGARWSVAIPAPSRELICHNDLAPWNLIIGERWTFIDWDGAGPSTRLWDLAYAAQAFTLNDIRRSPDDAAVDLAAFVGGYGADDAVRGALPAVMHQRATAMLELLESSRAEDREPWASMFDNGHGAHWRAATEYVGRHLPIWSSALHRGR